MSSIKTFVSEVNQKLMWPIYQMKFAKSVRPTDVFLATYPKSGTMWVGFLLANLIYGKKEPPLNLRTYLEFIPDVNNLYFEGKDLSQYDHMAEPRFFSTHAPYSPVFSRAIYILRDPRDVMVSYWYHTKLLKPWWKGSLEEFIADDKQQWPAPWDAHVRGWALIGRKNAFVVKYEDIKADPPGQVRRILEFLDFPCDKASIVHAVETAKFENMKSLEEKYGSGQHKDSIKGFVRQGKSGAWRDEISPAALKDLENRFGAVMKAVGYQLETE